ncbi:MAG: hypothetical protein IPL28_02680 [Chloroflexi bacterium]|nr:hypothetical protein [Chloroflexota bacterium]
MIPFIFISLFGFWIWYRWRKQYQHTLPYLGPNLANAYFWHNRTANLGLFIYFVIGMSVLQTHLHNWLKISDPLHGKALLFLVYSWGFVFYWAYHHLMPYPRQQPSPMTVRAHGPRLDLGFSDLKIWGGILLFVVLDYLLSEWAYETDYELTTGLASLVALLALSLVFWSEHSRWNLIMGEDGVNVRGEFVRWENLGFWVWNPIPKQENELLLVSPTMSRMWRIPINQQYRTAVEVELYQYLDNAYDLQREITKNSLKSPA